MPDVPNRAERESQLAALLQRAMGRSRDELITALGNPPDASRVPESVWQQIRQDIEDDARRVLAIILLLSMRRMNSEQFTVPPDIAAERAAAYAEERATYLADSLTDTLRTRLDRIASEIATEARLDTTLADTRYEAEIRRAVRESIEAQAEAAGITEVTSANSAGELAYRDMFEAETGVKLIGTWHIEDESACAICQELDGTTDEEWGAEHPGGPPGPHPQCRCWISWEPAEVFEGMEAR